MDPLHLHGNMKQAHPAAPPDTPQPGRDSKYDASKKGTTQGAAVARPKKDKVFTLKAPRDREHGASS
jgi:hypothetical protein